MNEITVVIPSFNSIKFIKECVSSVLSQTYQDMDILACDNESTDGTYEYLLSIKDKRFNVVSLPNIEPNGYREAIEYCFQNEKTGKFITFVCSDDFISPDYISNCMSIIKSVPDLECMQSAMTTVNENGKPTGIMSHSYNNLEDFKTKYLLYSPVNNPTVIYKKDLWPLIKDGREAHTANNLVDIGVGDYDLWGKFADNEIYIHPVISSLGYFYRWHPGQCTWIVKKQSTNYDQIIQSYWRKKWGM